LFIFNVLGANLTGNAGGVSGQSSESRRQAVAEMISQIRYVRTNELVCVWVGGWVRVCGI
jgi:predicted TIM-barrel enzyme